MQRSRRPTRAGTQTESRFGRNRERTRTDAAGRGRTATQGRRGSGFEQRVEERVEERETRRPTGRGGRTTNDRLRRSDDRGARGQERGTRTSGRPGREEGRSNRSARGTVRRSLERGEGRTISRRPDGIVESTDKVDGSEDYIAGRHPVIEALKTGRTINKMLVAENSEGGSLTEILGKAKAAGVIIQRVPRAKLDQIAGPHHQGVIIYVAPHEYAELEDIIHRKTGQRPLVLLLDEVEDPYNLGAVLRTAEATGVSGVIIPKRRSVQLTGVVAKVAAGALEHVPVARVTNLVQAMERLKKEGYWLVGADASATQVYTEMDYKGPIGIVIGAEGKGLSRLVKDNCDHLVKLPMLGTLQSLNASVATGVLLYEVVRQRV